MYTSIRLYFTLSLVLLGIGFSCSRDHLDNQPVNPTEPDYFKTELEFTKGVFGVYARLTDLYNFNASTSNVIWPVSYLEGDDLTNTQQDPFEHFGQLEAGNPRVDRYFNRLYQLIGRANTMLQKLEQEQGVYTTAGLKNAHKGEVLFLRGFAFFYLWNSFGKAPLVTQRVTTTAQLNHPESQGSELLDQAIKDLSEAATLLPSSWDDGNRGRATTNSAYGLLGKALVFRGTVNKTAADLTAAVEAFNKITGVSLVANYSDNFAFDTENNAESLFEFQASMPGTDNVWLPNEFDGAIGTMSAYWGFYYTGNNHNNDNIHYIATTKLVNIFEAADPRKNATLDAATQAIKKYVTRDQNANTGVGSVNNPRILRYADVLLLRAEAILQSGGSTTEAINLINQVRARARNMVNGGTVPADLSTAETNRTIIMQWIMDERLRELAAEGQRWFDLVRWHRAGYITLNNDFFSAVNSGVMGFIAPKHLLLPIPLSEMDKNPNINGNNPGY